MPGWQLGLSRFGPWPMNNLFEDGEFSEVDIYIILHNNLALSSEITKAIVEAAACVSPNIRLDKLTCNKSKLFEQCGIMQFHTWSSCLITNDVTTWKTYTVLSNYTQLNPVPHSQMQGVSITLPPFTGVGSVTAWSDDCQGTIDNSMKNSHWSFHFSLRCPTSIKMVHLLHIESSYFKPAKPLPSHSSWEASPQ